MADDRTEDPTLLDKLEGVTIFDKPSSEVIGPSKVKQPMRLKAPQKEMSGSSQVKELTEGNLRGQSPIQFICPSELNDALSDTRRLHLFDRFGWSVYKIRHGNIVGYLTLKNEMSNSGLLSDWTQDKVSVIGYGREYNRRISWNIDDDGAWIVFEGSLPLIEIISALAPLCQEVEHITTVIHTHGSQPFIPMRSVLTVCLCSTFAPLDDSLWTVSRCFPNARSLVLDCTSFFKITSRHHSGIPLSSLRRLELHILDYHDTLDNLFLLLSSSCQSQNIESLTVTSDDPLKWEKSRRAITECKLPNLTDIHLESRLSHEHYALQMISDLLRLGRMMSPSLKFVKVKSVKLGDVVMKSIEWSRTSSDCVVQIQDVSLLAKRLAFGYALRKSAAVPITKLIDITTSEFKDVTVLTLVSCKIDFGQSKRKSHQSPKDLGTLREIRFFSSEYPLSESDRKKLVELYPNVKVTEKQESQESSEESQEGSGIPSKLDQASSQSLKTSAIDKLSEVKVEFHEDTGSQNPEGGEEETSWQEKEEEFDVNKGSLSNESVPDEGDVETTKKECCKRVGADGGRLRLESFGIELEIPPGAIKSKEPQEICLRVLTDTPNLGDSKDEMSICFGVQCLAPDDLILRSPVTYTLPHCAVAARYSSLQAVLYSGEGEYSPHAVIKERKVLSQSGIPSCKIKKDVLELKMDHFSWAKIKIMIKNLFFRGKRMCFVPFKEKNLPLTKTPLILHANFYDDVQGNKETVKSDQEELGYKPAYDEQHVFIKKAEVDLKVTYCVDGNEERSAVRPICLAHRGETWGSKCRPSSVRHKNPDFLLCNADGLYDCILILEEIFGPLVKHCPAIKVV
ncbi:uncharacterized protein LOC135154945 [Lytechinus pictus]|uniref:uncharacterized protein LOC135154945 n=1 Tax=Lytechinus pictus TaxID=7653 RepID=UPI0030B9E17B